ncbi:hypothetical protein AOL_s00083g162 [Orbilia oligospora ATCC 24927]|uniref:SelT/selW/selH selenoprotein domain-containing protein n=2 Tax=Orbilia oligospora TaxID=2813651 RepID=G1XGN1_ARTOA|nr:hypothetical protein AOL_s00083g162 [Orbilia oligospora ATCC 24927]EGX47654.1 hypothetical protein AOL_s00083g162 [Orbilia oligospora ATCC 24927]KAF3285527.1 hypothetical protein TWF970_010573 [Orbilia oligospora]
MADSNSSPRTASVTAPVPRISIQFCIQCKWNLRAAYYAQELLQTFSTSLGEVSLRPSTGGIFIIILETLNEQSVLESHVIWDRKSNGGFPETKELKKKVRDIIDPNRDLGHVDGKKKSVSQTQSDQSASNAPQESPDDTQTGGTSGQESLGIQVVMAERKACEDCQ